MKIISEREPLDVYLQAAEICYNAVAHTLGPGGTNTAVVNKQGFHDIINDGYTILSKLSCLDTVVAEAIETIKLSAFETNRKAGDGTTSTTILTYMLLKGAIDYLKTANVTKVKLRDMINDYRDSLIDILHQTLSREISDNEYEAIAKVSLGSGKYASMISDAYRFLPEGLRPSIMKVDIPNVVIEKKDGIVLDKAECVVPIDTFVSGAKEMNDLEVYCLFDKLDRWQQIRGIIEQIIRVGKPAVIFYNELSMDILQNIQYQIVKGFAEIIPIRLGSYGIETRDSMKQIAKYTRSVFVDGIDIKLPRDNKNIVAGHLDYLLMSHDSVLITNHDFEDLDSISLPTKTAIIKVGGNNQTELEENYRRIEDAVNSLGNAISSGISIGAGLTYQRLSLAIEDMPQFIKDSLEAIYRRVVFNITGEDVSIDNEGLIPTAQGNFDLADDLQVFDATKVIEQVIINAFSLVSQVITTQVIVTEVDKIQKV